MQTEATPAMRRAMIEAYEEATGGDRLPDGEGLDGEIVAAMWGAGAAAWRIEEGKRQATEALQQRAHEGGR